MRSFDFELLPNEGIPPVDYSNIVAGPTPPCRVRFKRKKETFKVSAF